jgi:carbohydrate diacid regulator
MLNGTLESGVVKEGQKFFGTIPGVNLFIDYKNKHMGVICVSGDPDTVRTFSELVKVSLEAMLDYEFQMEREHAKNSKTEQFLYYLLFDENVDISVANIMAESLDIKKDVVRTCIIIKNSSEYNSKKIIEALMSADGHSNQDFVTFARNDDIIIFKALDNERLDAIKNYKQVINDYINDFINKLSGGDKENRMCITVGSLQDEISKYRESYIQAQDLGLQIKGEKGIYFFNDFILDYYRRLVTIKTYDNVFSVYNSLFNVQERKSIAEMVEVLSKNNYNIVNSAKELYIHRNTLLFRLNKVKDELNIDPVANAADREFLNELAYYFRLK